MCRVYSYTICICSSSCGCVGAMSVHIFSEVCVIGVCSGMYITSTVDVKHGFYLSLSIGRRHN